MSTSSTCNHGPSRQIVSSDLDVAHALSVTPIQRWHSVFFLPRELFRFLRETSVCFKISRSDTNDGGEGEVTVTAELHAQEYSSI